MVTRSKLYASPLHLDTSIESDFQKIKRYYRWQSPIFDFTRWSFLFGRKKIVKKLPINKEEKAVILEVGCGTGYNMKNMLRSYANINLYGIDLSKHMIWKARVKLVNFIRRLQLINEPFTPNRVYPFEQVDGILFSYTLSMSSPHWKQLILQAKKNLKPDGWIAVVDFHNTGFSVFRRHMANNRVKIDGHLLNFLRENFQIKQEEVHSAYGGVWSYFIFIGKKKE